MSSTPRDVFVSYNRADRAWAEWIAWVLEETGYSVAVQAWDSRPGQNFVLFMQESTRARQTVAVLSPSYLEADYTHSEWSAAFARDPQGAERTLIPVRVAECEPAGLLRQIVYADLVGLGEESARRTLLAAFRERGKPPTAPPFPGGIRTVRERPKPDFPGPPVAVALARLPVTGLTFVARERELARLDAAWEDRTNVISFVAMGGAGKSALINRWLDRMQEDGWRGAERVLGWSFYSQGTDAAGASSEAFTEYALDWLGYRGEPLTSSWRKGEILATFLRDKRTLLILDGLEPLQHPPGPQKGKIKDPTVQVLIRELAADNPGLCVLTTRLEVADVAGRAGTESVDLEKLPPDAGAELLRRLGVKGPEKELRATSQELAGHGLALTLLGTYLRDICEGDVRQRGEAAVLDETVGIEGSGHARNVMSAYETWFGPGPEVQVLRLLGLFDRPAEPAALEALRKVPEIPGLTGGIGAGEDKVWKAALARLRQARLVAPAESENLGSGESLDSHPLVREHFGERLRKTNPEAWREGNARLYEHYRQVAPELPDTLEAMLPLYAAVVHGCRARKEQEACDEVYKRRIQRGNEFFSTKKLGAFGTELTALAAFFERHWDLPSSRLEEADRAWLLNEAGFDLRALGRPQEAVQPIRSSTEIDIQRGDFKQAAASAATLSELTLILGDVAAAIATGKESVELAGRGGDKVDLLINRSIMADALHQSGRWEESDSLFRDAEEMQAEQLPEYSRLTSVQGCRYCELLLSRAEPRDGSSLERVGEEYRAACQQVRERAEYAVGVAERNRWLLDTALDYLSLGRAHLGLALTAPDQRLDLCAASEHLNRAVDGLQEAGSQDQLPRGLLARASLRRLAGDPDDAATDLREAQEIAERGSMRLHEADAHLEWTRLHLATGDRDGARRHFDRARELVQVCAYGRREREVTWLEGRLGEAS
jgi:tetratricopeptide (TPR) repeat protein